MAIPAGVLISDTLNQKIVASHSHDLDGDTQVMGLMTIPSCSIISWCFWDGN
jgi:hypothetical protein